MSQVLQSFSYSVAPKSTIRKKRLKIRGTCKTVYKNQVKNYIRSVLEEKKSQKLVYILRDFVTDVIFVIVLLLEFNIHEASVRTPTIIDS